MLAIAKEEQHFNLLLNRLRGTLFELKEKGTKTHDPDSFPNRKYDPNYVKISPIAQLLSTSLLKARTDFFNAPITAKSFEQFKETCLAAIENSKSEFGKSRDNAKWYN